MYRNPPASRVRYQVLAVACALALLTYINRLAFGVAASEIKADLALSDEQMGYLAAAFLVAYGIFQVPGGILGDRVGGRRLLPLLVLGWSLLSGATALGIILPAGTAAAFLFLLLLRSLFGMFQSAEFPSLSRVVSDWVPVHERGSAQGTIWMFSRVGGAIVPFLFTGMLGYFHTWTTPFGIMAVLGVLWAAGFWPWFRDRPEDMPQVNSAELAIIQAGRSPASSRQVSGPGIWRSPDIWALCAMYSLVGFAGNFFTNLMPLYLKDHRHLTGLDFSVLSAMPLAWGIASCVLGGALSDWVMRRWRSRKWGRRLVGSTGLFLAGLATLLIPWADNVYYLGFLLSAAFFCNDLNMGPAWAACADIGERSTGTISGAMNMTGAFAGALGAALAGHLFKRNHDEWVFVIYAGSYALAGLVWLIVNVDRRLTVESQAATILSSALVGNPMSAGLVRDLPDSGKLEPCTLSDVPGFRFWPHVRERNDPMSHLTGTENPLRRLDDWEDFVEARYPAPRHKATEEYRNYENPARDTVRDFYRLNHGFQTFDFVRQKKQEFLRLDRRQMTVYEALDLLDTLVDDSDPDIALAQREHLLQTAEAIRADGHEDWFVLTGLIHDLGKILCLFGEPQWAVVGDTFPVGCAFSDRIVYPEFFAGNPDTLDPRFRTRRGVYDEGCGLRKVHLSWGHDEYLYHVVKEHLPEPALYMIRYHSFYAWHREGEYQHLLDPHDRRMLSWVQKFNSYDLYSKSPERPNWQELEPYYAGLIAKYLPGRFRW